MENDTQPPWRSRPWLAALKRIHADAALPQVHEPATQRPDTNADTDTTDKSPSLDEADVAWRVAAFRAAVPAHGPVLAPGIRNAATCDTPGHCHLCGDRLPRDPATRFPRCAPCARALRLALSDTGEQVAE
jgi:hypothetical protein